MKVFKSLIKISLISIAIIVALVFVLIGVLFIFPNLTLFGLRFLNYSTAGTEYKTFESSITKDPISSIVVDGGAFNVHIKPSNVYEEGIRIALIRNVMGITTRSSGEITAITDYDSVKDILYISIHEPSGVILHQDCTVTIYLPSDFCDNNIKFNITTGGGDIVLGKLSNNESNATDDKIIFSSPKLSTKKGNIMLGNIKIIERPIFVLNKGSFSNTTDTLFDATDTTIETYDSKIDLSKASPSDDFCFGKLIINNKSAAKIKLGDCLNIDYIGNSGSIEILSCENISIDAKNTDVTIDKINASALVVLTGDGTFSAKLINGYSDITTSSGSINILETAAKLSLNSKKGNINVANATKHITATTTSGNINVVFKQNTPYNDSINGHRQVMATSDSGNIALDGVDFVNIKINKSGKGSINVRFHDLAQKESVIDAKDIKINIWIPTKNASDPTGSDMIIVIATLKHPEINIVFGSQLSILDNTYTYNFYDATSSTLAKLIIDAGKGLVTVNKI